MKKELTVSTSNGFRCYFDGGQIKVADAVKTIIDYCKNGADDELVASVKIFDSKQAEELRTMKAAELSKVEWKKDFDYMQPVDGENGIEFILNPVKEAEQNAKLEMYSISRKIARLTDEDQKQAAIAELTELAKTYPHVYKNFLEGKQIEATCYANTAEESGLNALVVTLEKIAAVADVTAEASAVEIEAPEESTPAKMTVTVSGSNTKELAQKLMANIATLSSIYTVCDGTYQVFDVKTEATVQIEGTAEGTATTLDEAYKKATAFFVTEDDGSNDEPADEKIFVAYVLRFDGFSYNRKGEKFFNNVADAFNYLQKKHYKNDNWELTIAVWDSEEDYNKYSGYSAFEEEHKIYTNSPDFEEYTKDPEIQKLIEERDAKAAADKVAEEKALAEEKAREENIKQAKNTCKALYDDWAAQKKKLADLRRYRGQCKDANKKAAYDLKIAELEKAFKPLDEKYNAAWDILIHSKANDFDEI